MCVCLARHSNARSTNTKMAKHAEAASLVSFRHTGGQGACSGNLEALLGQRRELDRQIQAYFSSASASQSFGVQQYAQHASQSVQTHVLPPHPAAQSSYANLLSNRFAHGNLGVPTPVVHQLNQHPVIAGFAFGSPFPSPLCGLPPGYCTPISMAPQPQPMIPPSANQPDAHSQCAVAYSGYGGPATVLRHRGTNRS